MYSRSAYNIAAIPAPQVLASARAAKLLIALCCPRIRNASAGISR